MTSEGHVEIQTLALLEALVGEEEFPVPLAQRRIEEMASADLKDLPARIWILVARLGYTEIDPRRLASAWSEQISQHPDATRRDLLATARALSLEIDSTKGKIGRWRRAVLAALQLPLESIETVESLAPGIPEDGRKRLLALKPMLTDWPRRVLESREWAYADAPLPDMEPLKLDAVWVDLQLVVPEEVSDLPRQSTMREALDQRYEDRHWHRVPLEWTLERLDDSAVLVGPPGCGKTTMLKWIARRMILQPTSRYQLPLWVPLRSYGLWQKDHPGGNLLDYGLYNAGVSDPSQRRLWSEVLNYMVGSDAECVLLLLDGWDEVRPEDRQTVNESIEWISNAFPVLVTSRPSGYPRNLPILDIYQIAELAPESMDTLIDRWFEQVGKPSLADDLKIQLVQSLDLRRMARNPFLLSLMCGISYRDERDRLDELPKTRAALYENAISLILSHHDQLYPESPFLGEDQRQVEHLALWLLDEAPGAPRFVFSREDMEHCSQDPWRLESLLLPSRLLSQLGLSDQNHHFLHATFQEFLAARGLKRRDQAFVLDTLRRHLFDVAWLEVLQFLVGQEGIHLGVFWREVERLCQQPDIFGHVYLRVARFAAEALVQEGGVEELGIDLRETLWQGVVASNHSSRFFEALAALDASDLLVRVREALSGDDLARDRCLRNLGRLAGPEASELVLDRLLDADPVEFPEALEQLRLRRYLHPDGLARLRRAALAKDLDLQRRKSLLHALSEIRDLGSIPELIELARGQPETAGYVLDSLGWMGGAEATQALQEMAGWKDDFDWQQQITAGLGMARTPEARDILLQRLAFMSEEDPLLPIHLEALGGLPIFSGTELIKTWLSSDDSLEVVRVASAKALENAVGSKVAEALLEAARNDTSEAVRMAALESVENRGRKDHLDWLAERVNETSRNVEERCLALRVFLKTIERFRRSSDGAEHIRKTEEVVSEILSEEPEEPLVRAAVQLAHVAGQAVGPKLVDIASDLERSTALRIEACQGLARLQYQDAMEVLVELVRQGPESRHRDRRSGLLGPWAEELPFRMSWQGDRVSVTPWDVDLDAAKQEVGQAAADALARIQPSRLLGMAGKSAANALSGWALESGSLVFEDHILGSDGKVIARRHDVAASGMSDHAVLGIPLRLHIRVPDPEKPKELIFELESSNILSSTAHETFGPIQLGRHPKDFRKDLVEDIRSDLTTDFSGQSIGHHRLRSKGATLLKILPEGLRHRLLSLRHQNLPLQLVSEDLHLPWELLLLADPEPELADALFLAEAFSATRWTRSATSQLQFDFSRVALVFSESNAHGEGGEEVEDLSTLLGAQRVERIPPTYQAVRAALASGQFDAWHFIGHGGSWAEDADRWELMLEDGHALRPEDFREPGFGLRCPWVFLNTCASGQVGEGLAGPSGWALQCLEAGAGVFIGTHWAVPGGEAREFALALYQSFLLGASLGDAVRSARDQVKNAFPASPTWLAYTVYGHPEAQVGSQSRLPPAR